MLEDIAARRGISMSEAIRQSLGLMQWWIETRASGSRLLVERPNGSVVQVLNLEF